jgi:hypothetical protein
MNPLPIVPAHQLASRSEEPRWLIESLWAEQAVGIVGGEPKCCKSFLALDMAVSVASGRSCLRRFHVPRKGRVLLYAAEDAHPIVRARLEGICAAAGIEIDTLDVHVITAPMLRLDQYEDQRRLDDAVARSSPRLLVLDPFVRLHRIDENSSAEVAPLLAQLRELQRRHDVAVVLVHHARKGAANARPGQALRGSSEFHAWSDSALHLRRIDDRITLSVEHRAAASAGVLTLELRDRAPALALHVVDATPSTSEPRAQDPKDRVLDAIAAAHAPLAVADIAERCPMRTQRLYAILGDLVRAGHVARDHAGYRLMQSR